MWRKIQDDSHPQMKSLKMVTKNIFQNKITFVHKFSKWQRIETLQKKEKERKKFLSNGPAKKQAEKQ